ncbi:MAG: hypothetical protein CGW95_15300, partial [Phenylobacterium zucineum]
FKKYADFRGRARRSEYWFAYLFSVLVSYAASVVTPSRVDPVTGNTNVGTATIIWSLVVIVPGFAVATRRLHDTGRSGKTLLWLLLPFVGAIIVLVYLVGDSQPGPNQYGDPVK